MEALRSSDLETEILKIKKAIIKTGRRLKELMYSNDDELFTYSDENVAGHRSLVVDLLAEDLLVRNLVHHKIGGRVLSEESGNIPLNVDSASQFTFVIDPIDGSNNYRRGIPFNCISVAFSSGLDEIAFSSVEHGILYDFNTGNIFEFHLNDIYFNGQEIYKSINTGPKVISYYYYGKHIAHNYPFEKQAKIRTLGCAALELVYVAYGGFDAFIDIRGNLRSYDYAVAAKIVQLMGGQVTIISDDDNPRILPHSEIMIDQLKAGYKLIAARSRELHDEILHQIYPEFTV